MFDGNTFFPVTGTPIRKMACMMRPLADADPVPLAVAILKAKSLTRFIQFPGGSTWTRHTLNSRCRLDRLSRQRNLDGELPHVPRVGGAALGAQPAVQAHVLVLHHHAPGLLQRARR